MRERVEAIHSPWEKAMAYMARAMLILIPQGFLGWKATDVFYRQIRNLQIDVTNVPANRSVQCIHWPTSQATSLQNIVFHMSQASGSQHGGLLVEEGDISSWGRYTDPANVCLQGLAAS